MKKLKKKMIFNKMPEWVAEKILGERCSIPRSIQRIGPRSFPYKYWGGGPENGMIEDCSQP
jgi:hypothetical protein